MIQSFKMPLKAFQMSHFSDSYEYFKTVLFETTCGIAISLVISVGEAYRSKWGEPKFV